MRRILDGASTEFSTDSAPWAANRDDSSATVAAGAFGQFSKAFDRWRQLYLSAHAQLTEANRKSEMHGLSGTERKDAKIAQAQANEQLPSLKKAKPQADRTSTLTVTWQRKVSCRAITFLGSRSTHMYPRLDQEVPKLPTFKELAFLLLRNSDRAASSTMRVVVSVFTKRSISPELRAAKVAASRLKLSMCATSAALLTNQSQSAATLAMCRWVVFTRSETSFASTTSRPFRRSG